MTLVDTGDDTLTGGRLKRVQPYLNGEDFCFTYGDGLSDVDITALIAFHKAHGKWATVTAVQPPGHRGCPTPHGRAHHASVESRNRDRIPSEMRRQFGLYIAAPTAGSLNIQGVIGGPLELLGAEEGIARVSRLFKDSWQVLVHGDWATLEALLPDRMRRQRWVDAAAKVPPRPGSGMALRLDIGEASVHRQCRGLRPR